MVLYPVVVEVVLDRVYTQAIVLAVDVQFGNVPNSVNMVCGYPFIPLCVNHTITVCISSSLCGCAQS